ncbi:MAG: hypothetical protein ACWGMZ_08330, partial [Thermoguttaceae bacterium]
KIAKRKTMQNRNLVGLRQPLYSLVYGADFIRCLWSGFIELFCTLHLSGRWGGDEFSISGRILENISKLLYTKKIY